MADADNGQADERSTAHACAVPVSEEQLWELTARFVAAGLVAGEQVVYFDDGTVDAVLERLVDDRVPVRRPLADGQLTVVDTEKTRQSLRGAVGDAARMLATHIDGAVHAGYAGLRMTGQFDSALLRGDGVGLPEYDAALDAVLDGRPARLLCLYDRRRFSDDAIERMRALHRIELERPALYDDSLLRITRLGPFRRRLAGEVDHSNRPVVPRMSRRPWTRPCGPTTRPPRSSSTWRRCASSTSRARWAWCTRPRSSPRRTGWC